jgi:hypothetical protein
MISLLCLRAFAETSPAPKAKHRNTKAAHHHRAAAHHRLAYNEFSRGLASDRIAYGYGRQETPRSTELMPAAASAPEDSPFALMTSFGGGIGSAYNDAATAPAFDLNVDFTAWKYFGLETEGFYILTGQTSSTGVATQSRAWGVVPDLKFQLPFTTGRIQWTPRLGLGYALFQTGLLTGASAENTSISGLVGLIGLQIEIYSTVILKADYLSSFSSSTTSATDSAFASAPSTAQIQRIRAGADVRVTSHFLVGAGAVSFGSNYGKPTILLGDIGYDW